MFSPIKSKRWKGGGVRKPEMTKIRLKTKKSKWIDLNCHNIQKKSNPKKNLNELLNFGIANQTLLCPLNLQKQENRRKRLSWTKDLRYGTFLPF